VLLGQSELHLAVLHHNKKTTQRNPKFFFQLPQPSTFSTHASLRQPTLELLVKLSTCIHHTVTIVKAFMLVDHAARHLAS
jgi:hypothetical protein